MEPAFVAKYAETPNITENKEKIVEFRSAIREFAEVRLIITSFLCIIITNDVIPLYPSVKALSFILV